MRGVIKAESLRLPKQYKSPLFILWDLSSSCNHKCMFCYNNCFNQADTKLSLKHLEMIAEQIIQNEVVSVAIGGGEPLLQKDAVFHLGRILKNKVWLILATNGTLITSSLAKPLSEMFSAVQISLHGYGDELDELTRVHGTYRKVIHGIESLSCIGFNKIEICFVLTRLNHHLFKPMVEELMDMGNIQRIRVQNLIPSGMGYVYRELLYLEPNEVKAILVEYRKFIESKGNKIAFIYDDVADELAELRKGNKPNPFLHIHSDGNVGVFPHIPVILGNLKDESLQSIWERKGADFFHLNEIKIMLDSIICNKDIGFYETHGIRPWIDKPLIF